MERQLAGRVALVTGAAAGIGRETALLFTREGARVVGVDVDERGGAETARLVGEEGGECAFFRADVSRDADCRGMVEEAERRFGRLDVLFNNAGIMDPADDDAVATDEAVWDRTMAVNAKG
ncbi:MAG: SDR family NAD(P)-dependent oxidoreductase, partial [Alphaproteobacteria bacterium]